MSDSDHFNVVPFPELGSTRNGNSSNGSGGVPPGGDGMDGRIRDLERDMTDMKVALGKVETRLENISQNMLTKAQMAIYTLGVGIVVFSAGWWVVQQYLAPLVANLPR
ncbi:hypothetical protein [Stutzerimonas kunmingensis]|uniref:hypothetical protein n=1 Tax=Stutzerimonas kunmingensis TaxID=1211807 RepID=UPI0015E40AD2|nr:hypothetical protein [Stutzerimonas kunmingensis]